MDEASAAEAVYSDSCLPEDPPEEWWQPSETRHRGIPGQVNPHWGSRHTVAVSVSSPWANAWKLIRVLR